MKGKESEKNLSAIIRSLKQEDTPWKKKINLGHKILSKNCHFPNKFQIILGWACQEIVYNSTQKCYPSDMLEELWEIVFEVFQITKNEREVKLLSLKASFIEALMKEFQTTNTQSLAFIECCKVIFLNKEFYRPIVTKIEKFVSFLTDALNHAGKYYDGLDKRFLSDPGGTKKLLVAYLDLVDIMLKLYLSIQKEKSNTQKVAIRFNEKLLKEIINWNSILSKFEEKLDLDSKGVDLKHLLNQILWNRENMSAIRGQVHLLTGENSMGDKETRKFALLDSLFLTVERSANVNSENEKDTTFSNAMLEFVPELYRTFLIAGREVETLPRHFEFFIFKKYCVIISKCFDSIETCNKKPVAAVKCIHKLLEILVDFNIFKVNNDTVNTDANRKFLQNLTLEVISRINTSCLELAIELLECVRYLMDVDRSLFDNYMLDVLQMLLTDTTADNSKANEGQLVVSKNNVLAFILGSYTQTRQIEDFLKILVYSIHDIQTEVHIDPSFFKRMAEITATVPVGKSLSVIKMINDELTRNYQKVLDDFAGESTAGLMLGNIKYIIRKLNILLEILCIFMLNIRILPLNGYHGESQEKYVNFVKSSYKILIPAIMNFAAEINERGIGTNDIFVIAWRLMNSFQRIDLYLLHHDMISSPLVSQDDLFPMINRFFKCEEHWSSGAHMTNSLCVEAVILQMKLNISVSNSVAFRKCCKKLELFIDRFTSPGTSSIDQEGNSSVIAIFYKELPWLLSHLSSSSVSQLCTIFFECATEKPSLENERPLERCLGSAAISPELQILLSSTIFYDDVILQTAFCDILSKKIRLIFRRNFTHQFITSFDNFVELSKGMNREVNNERVSEEHSDNKDKLEESKCHPSYFSKLSDACNDVLSSLLVMCLNDQENMDIEYNEKGLFDSGNPQIDIKALLKIMNLVNAEWLAAENAAKLIISLLIVQWRTISNIRDNPIWAEQLIGIFHLLEKFTSLSILAKRMGVWNIVDPAILVQWVTSIMKNFGTEHPNQMPNVVWKFIRNLFTIMFEVKRNEINKACHEALKLQMKETGMKLALKPDDLSLRLLNILLSVTLKVLEGKVIKKRSLATGLAFTFPVIEQILRANPIDFAVLEENSMDNESTFLTLRCLNHVFSICLLMKKSGKDLRFMTLLDDSSMKDHITNAAAFIHNFLIKNEKELANGYARTLSEEVCLEFLQMILQHEHSIETEHLYSSEFCEPVFTVMLSTITKIAKDKREPDIYVPYFQIMSNIINQTTEDASCRLLKNVFQRAISIADEKVVEVLLKFFDSILRNKSSKDNKKKFKEILPKLWYLCIEKANSISANDKDELVIASYQCIITVLAFTKGLFIMSSIAASSLQCVIAPIKVTKEHRVLDVFLLRVKLLSVLMFHHTQAALGAMASFINGVRSILHEFTSMKESGGPVSSEDTWVVCENISRLYQEIASHKDLVAEYVPYLLADYLKVVCLSSMPQKFQNCLNDGIFCLIGICTARDSAYLNMALSQAERELFKELYKAFNKHHKFRGKA